MKKKITWKSHYGIAGDLTLKHDVDEYGSLYISPIQARKIRNYIGESEDYYVGLTLPYKGEGCWVADPS